jgi:hypothetical protein
MRNDLMRLSSGIVGSVITLCAIWFAWVIVYLGGAMGWLSLMALGVLLLILSVRLIVLGARA